MPFLHVKTQMLKLWKGSAKQNIRINEQTFNESIRLKCDSYPITIIKSHDHLEREFLDILDKNNCYLITNEIDYEIKVRPTHNNRTLLDRIQVAMDEFRREHFDTARYERNSIGDETTWQRLCNQAQQLKRNSGNYLVSVLLNSILIEMLKSEIGQLKNQLDELIRDEKKKAQLKVDEISPIEWWKSRFIKSFLLDSLKHPSVNVMVNEQDIKLQGPAEMCDSQKAKIHKILDTITQSSIKSSEEYLDVYFTSNIDYINKLLKEQNLKAFAYFADRLCVVSNDIKQASGSLVFIKQNFKSEKIQTHQAVEKFYLPIEREKQTNKHSFVCKFENDYILVAGEAQSIQRIENMIAQHLNKNKITVSDLTHEFTYEDVKFIQAAYSTQIEQLNVECMRELNMKEKPFQLLLNDIRENFTLNVCANSEYLSKYLELINNCLKSKKVDIFDLDSSEKEDIFNDDKISAELTRVQTDTKCVILKMLYKSKLGLRLWHDSRHDSYEFKAIDFDDDHDHGVDYDDCLYLELSSKDAEQGLYDHTINELENFLYKHEKTILRKTLAIYLIDWNIAHVESALNLLVFTVRQCMSSGLATKGKIKAIHFRYSNPQLLNDIIENSLQFSSLADNISNANIDTHNSQWEIKFGSLSDESLHVDVIVNSVNAKLELNNGAVSQAILNLAGPGIQQELKTKYPAGLNESNKFMAVGGVGNLSNKKYIIHVTLNQWDARDMNKSEKTFEKCILNILGKAEELKANSIAFPALGTGALKYPRDQVAKILIKTVQNYLSKTRSTSTIQKVYFVLYEADKQTVEAFKHQYQTIEDTETIVRCKFANSLVSLAFYEGNILDCRTEALVNFTNEHFEMNGNIGAALFNHDKQFAQNMDDIRKNFKRLQIVRVDSDQFSFKKVVHVDWSTPNLFDFILISVDNEGIRSVTLHLEDENNHVTNDRHSLIMAFLNSVDSFSYQAKSITQINVCLSKDDFVLIKKILKENKPIERHALKLIANSEEKINECTKCLQQIVQREIKTDQIQNEHLKEIDLQGRKHINHIGGNYKVKLEWNVNNNTITVHGRQENQLKAFKQIYDYLTQTIKQKEVEIRAKFIAERVQWECLCQNNEWTPFNMYLNIQLENKYALKSPVDHCIRLLDEKNNYFKADFEKFEMTYENSAEIRKIRRMEIDNNKINILVPKSWHYGLELNLIELAPNHLEYERVKQFAIERGLPLKKILGIKRIQNKFLYAQYCTFKQQLEQKYARKVDELSVFHGTFEDSVENIWKTGFNRSYAGRNATYYGKGVYFASNSSYSHKYTDLNRNKNVGHMFICRILVGEMAVGNKNMSVPPDNKDTTVDKMPDPNIYVIYKDSQAYPEYLLTYE